MRLKALMVNLIPANETILKTGKFTSQSIEFLNLEKYPNQLRLGIESDEKCFITKSHFRVDNDLYIPAFQIIDLDELNSKNYDIKYSPKRENFQKSLYYDERYNVYYDLPMVKIKGKKWDYSNDIEKASVGSINAGVFYLNIYKRNAQESINSKPYKMCILPSSMSLEQYEIMINDLLNIKHEIIMEDKKGAKQSLQAEWTNTLEEIKSVIKAIRKPLVKINKTPKVKLSQETSNILPEKVKRFNNKIITQLSVNQGSLKLKAYKDREDKDIYENQMLLYALKRLFEYVRNFGDYVKNKNVLRRQIINLEIKKMKDYYNIDIDNLYNIVSSNNKSRFYDLIMSKDRNFEDEDNKGIIEIILPIVRYNNDINFSMYFAEGKLYSKIEGKWIGEGKFSLDYNKLSYTLTNEEHNKEIEIRGKKVYIELETSDISQHLLLYDSIFNSDYHNVKIHAKVKINSYNKNDLLMGKPVYDSSGNPYINIFEYNIKIVHLISINNAFAINRIKNNEQLKELFIKKGIIRNRDQIINQILMLKKKINNIETENFKSDIINNNICNELKNLSNLDFFKTVSFRKNLWSLTQIFINDKNYSKLFKILRKLDRKLQFTESINSNDIINKKADKLYEYWILVKILYLLTREQQWMLEGNKSITDIISEFLKGKNKNELENIEFTLTHKVKDNSKHIKMVLFFNKVFANKNPDFAFKIIVSGEKFNKEKWFYLDAKYRDYKSMGQHFWYYDINHVAIEKYINCFKKTNAEAAASFIVHTDDQEKYLYFGGFFNEELAKGLTSWQDDNPQHKFGSFYFLPSKTEHFITFTKLMLEYHFMDYELWRICWDCGSIDTLVEPKTTGSGREKFYITCNNCHSFWVRNHCEAGGHRLIKHAVNNYHKETSDGDPWYVKCPECNHVKIDRNIEFIDLAKDDDIESPF